MHRMPATVEALAKGRFAGRLPVPSGDKRKLPVVSPDQSPRKFCRSSRPPDAEMVDVSGPSPSLPPPAPVSAAPPPPPPAPAVVDDGFVLVERKKGKHRTLRPRPHPAAAALRASPPLAKPAEPQATVLFYPVSSEVSLHSLPRLRLGAALQRICQTVSAVRFVRRGGVAVDYSSSTPAAPILATESILDTPVRASLPKPREGCIGTIVGDFSTREELQELYELCDDNPPLLKVQQIGTTRTWILFFSPSCSSLPPRVRIFYNIHRVRPFFHSPLQCYKCQRFGHPADLCRGAVVCSRCAEKGHSFRDCPSTAERCVNCAGDHSARHKQCSHRVFAVRVQRHLASNPVSRFEARVAVASSFPPPSQGSKPVSYASAVSSCLSASPPLPGRAPSPVPLPSPSTVSFGTQTDPLPPPPSPASLGTQTDLLPPPPSPVSLGTQTDPPALSIPEIPGFPDLARDPASRADLASDPFADSFCDPDLFPPYHEVVNQFMEDFLHASKTLGFNQRQQDALIQLCRMYYEK